MAKALKRGDHVAWNSEAGRVGVIILKKVVSDVRFKGHVHQATRDNPQYFIESENGTHRNSQRLRPSTFEAAT